MTSTSSCNWNTRPTELLQNSSKKICDGSWERATVSKVIAHLQLLSHSKLFNSTQSLISFRIQFLHTPPTVSVGLVIVYVANSGSANYKSINDNEACGLVRNVYDERLLELFCDNCIPSRSDAAVL